MDLPNKTRAELEALAAQLPELHALLEEARENLHAMRSGDIDALIVAGPGGDRLFTLTGAQEPYRNLVEEMSEGAVTIAADATILYANRSFAEMVGTRPDRIVGANFRDFVLAADRAAFESVLGQARTERCAAELLLQAAGEKSLPVRLAAAPLRGDGNAIACLIATNIREHREREASLRGMMGELAASQQTVEETNRSLQRETTERAQAEKSRAESEIRLADIVNSSEDAIISKALDGTVTSWNPGAERMFGYAAAEIVGQSLTRLFPPESLAEENEMLARIGRGERVGNYDAERVCQDGTRILVSTTLSPIADADGKIFGLSRISRDITERKRVEEKLRITEMRYRRLFEAAHDGVLLLDPATRKITDANPFIMQLIEYPREELVGRELFEIGLLEDEAASQAMFQVLQREHCVRYQDLPLESKSGRRQQVEVVANLYDEGGHAVIQCNIRDITERFAAEENLRQLHSELEKRVVERTAQLEVANKELEAFSYSVSHDLRAPLRSIDGFSRILLEDYAGKLDEEAQDSLRRVRAASQHMGHLIDDMLKLSRVTRTEMQVGAVDLSMLARRIAAALEQEEPARRVEWVIADGLTVQADPALLRVALQNLLANAWKFTGKQPQARIEVGVMEHEGERTHFVRDNGAGFDMAYAGKLFGAFQRLHDATEFPGTGIGLATVQRVLHRHGGRIWAEAAAGQGATFFFTLPGLPAPTPDHE